MESQTGVPYYSSFGRNSLGLGTEGRVDTPTARMAADLWPLVEKGVHTIIQNNGPRAVIVAEYLAVASVSAQKNPLHMKIRARAQFEDGSGTDLCILVDTGSEVNIIRSGLVARSLLTKSASPIKFLTASSEVLVGGEREVQCELLIDGLDRETRTEARARIPITWYEAQISVDAIVSLAWLAAWNVDLAVQGAWDANQEHCEANLGERGSECAQGAYPSSKSSVDD